MPSLDRASSIALRLVLLYGSFLLRLSMLTLKLTLVTGLACVVLHCLCYILLDARISRGIRRKSAESKPAILKQLHSYLFWFCLDCSKSFSIYGAERLLGTTMV